MNAIEFENLDKKGILEFRIVISKKPATMERRGK
jgi:hypothetical protein